MMMGGGCGGRMIKTTRNVIAIMTDRVVGSRRLLELTPQYNLFPVWKSTSTTNLIPELDLKGVSPSSAAQTGWGKIYDKKPFKFNCIKGKEYMWCACGESKTQPFCDSLCKNTHYKITMRPVKFIAPESKDYWFCNCKQTLKRPFCDGTHRREDVIAAIRI